MVKESSAADASLSVPPCHWPHAIAMGFRDATGGSL